MDRARRSGGGSRQSGSAGVPALIMMRRETARRGYASLPIGPAHSPGGRRPIRVAMVPRDTQVAQKRRDEESGSGRSADYRPPRR
jgi:hypothetical protein